MSALLAGCSDSGSSPDVLNSRKVTMPQGETIIAEVVMTPEDMARGMMFRESLAGDRGMLFVHPVPGNYSYWMFQVKIPLDIIWMDQHKRIVEIVENIPGCAGPAETCPSYGGRMKSQYVLELRGGRSRELGLHPGAMLAF